MRKNEAAKYSDQELLQKYVEKGQQYFLATLFQRYTELIYGVCLKYLQDPPSAEDAVLGIYEQLHKKLPQQKIDNFRPWLYVFTKNYCLMQIRKEKKGQFISTADPQLMQSDLLWHPVSEESKDSEQKFQNLDHCIEQLSIEQRHCIHLFYLKEKSYKEVAELTQRPLGKVRSFIQNGRRNLKNCIEKLEKQS